MRYDALVWDWNGTLLDDVHLSCGLLNTMLARHGYAEIGDVEAYKAVFAFPIEEYYRRAGFNFTHTPYKELAAEYIPLYTQKAKKCSLAPFARETLDAFAARAVRQIILSASQRELLLSQLEQHELCHYFTDVCGLNDCYASSKIELGTKWAAKCGIDKKRILMVGDTEHDSQTAQEMGIECILYSGGHSPRSKLQATGRKVIDSLSELVKLI